MPESTSPPSGQSGRGSGDARDLDALTRDLDALTRDVFSLGLDQVQSVALIEEVRRLRADQFVVARRREHRAYDSQQTHGTDLAGDRFICGWCGGWGHKAAAGDGRPQECYECSGLGWYVNG